LIEDSRSIVHCPTQWRLSPRGMAAAHSDVRPLMCLRIVKGQLLTNIEFGGKMDPFVEVRTVAADGGGSHKIAQTHTDWNGHFTPVWDYTCRGHPFDADERLELRVLEDDMIGKADLCGAGTIRAAELFEKVDDTLSKVTSTGKEVVGPIIVVPIEKKGKNEGSVTVQAILVPPDYEAQDQALQPSRSNLMTLVPPETFITPVRRLGVSGGTAPFFRLELADPASGMSMSHYIGKDLSRAQDEIDFYEAVAQCKDATAGKAEGLLFPFMFDYAGVFKCIEDRGEDLVTATSSKSQGELRGKSSKKLSIVEDKVLELLVLRNLHDGCSKLRLLDIKIGQKTAQAGWQGKSSIAALRQSVIDGITTSAAQGFRLEGFDGEPKALTSMDPLLDFGGSGAKSKATKKAKRVMLQRMSASEMMMHLVDVSELDSQVSKRTMHPAEYGEIVLHEMMTRMVYLAVACRQCPVPQKWIGSSVALGFDCGELPTRAQGEAKVRRDVRVNIFDWGRSELNTIKRHAAMSEADRQDRAKFWSYYCGGIDRLAWEVSRAYLHRYGSGSGWQKLLLRIQDFDSASANDFIGQVYFEKLGPTPQTTVALTGKDNKKKMAATLTYSIEYVKMPNNSRLAGIWRIHVHSAAKIPNKDALMLQSKSDPFVEVIAISKDQQCRLRQQSEVVVDSLDPVWNAVFDLPEARSMDHFKTALGQEVIQVFNDEPMASVFVSEEPPEINGKMLSDSARDKAMAQWTKSLDAASARVSPAQIHKSMKERADWTEEDDLDRQLNGMPDAPPSGFGCFSMCAQLSKVPEESNSNDKNPPSRAPSNSPRPGGSYQYVPAKEEFSPVSQPHVEGAVQAEKSCPCLCQ